MDVKKSCVGVLFLGVQASDEIMVGPLLSFAKNCLGASPKVDFNYGFRIHEDKIKIDKLEEYASKNDAIFLMGDYLETGFDDLNVIDVATKLKEQFKCHLFIIKMDDDKLFGNVYSAIDKVKVATLRMSYRSNWLPYNTQGKQPENILFILGKSKIPELAQSIGNCQRIVCHAIGEIAELCKLILSRDLETPTKIYISICGLPYNISSEIHRITRKEFSNQGGRVFLIDERAVLNLDARPVSVPLFSK